MCDLGGCNHGWYDLTVIDPDGIDIDSFGIDLTEARVVHTSSTCQ